MVNEELQEYPSLFPVGLHPTSLNELQRLCVDSFPDSRTRLTIFEALSLTIEHLKVAGVPGKLWIDGSFLTDKPNPNDVDILLVLTDTELEQSSPQAREAIQWFVTQPPGGSVCDTYTLILSPLTETGITRRQWLSHWNYSRWIGFFGFSRLRSPKGIAVLVLEEA
jgi:hypothetical protein